MVASQLDWLKSQVRILAQVASHSPFGVCSTVQHAHPVGPGNYYKRSPPPFEGVSRAPGAGQTRKLNLFRVRGTNQVTNANRSYPFWLSLSLNRLSRIPNCHGCESRLWPRRFGRACQRFWRPGSDAGGRAAFDKGGEGGDTLGWHRSPLPAPSSAAALVGPAW